MLQFVVISAIIFCIQNQNSSAGYQRRLQNSYFGAICIIMQVTRDVYDLSLSGAIRSTVLYCKQRPGSHQALLSSGTIQGVLDDDCTEGQCLPSNAAGQVAAAAMDLATCFLRVAAYCVTFYSKTHLILGHRTEACTDFRVDFELFYTCVTVNPKTTRLSFLAAGSSKSCFSSKRKAVLACPGNSHEYQLAAALSLQRFVPTNEQSD